MLPAEYDIHIFIIVSGHAVAQLDEALRYK
jgi:hypothetical protein